jgi:hypothetical protein
VHTPFEGLELFITGSFFNVWESCLDTTAVVCHLRGGGEGERECGTLGKFVW